ncbi:MAG: hypothetical protein MR283_07940 [Erysipelotrichaceae bacterium]|nr:hypothetical protein [Erysipelotrichaceae bacterium]MDY6035597.1 hypothetical protein [Bulleidia sp.]
MLLKVVREYETKYYVPEQIQAMTVSAVYNHDDMFDVTFIVNGISEPVRTFPSKEEAEEFLTRLDTLYGSKDPSVHVVNLSTL